MSNETITSGLAGLFTDIQQAAMFTAQEAAQIRPLIREFNLIGQPGKQANVGIYPNGTALTATTGEGTDASNQQISVTQVQIDTDEVAFMTTLTDTARDSAADDIAASIGKIFGEQLARKIDEDLVALFTGFSSSVGDYSTVMSVELVMKAVATLRNSSVMGPYHCVVSPFAAYDLKRQLTNAGATTIPSLSNLGNTALQNGFIGSVAGVNFFESALVGSTAVGEDSTGTASAALFTPEALGLAMKKDITIETERNASVRGTELICSSTYGVKEIKDGEGILIKCENDINTVAS